MKILALITARSGSKRLPNKNMLNLGGKPLVKWSIDTLKDIKGIKDILLSTDDSQIAKIGKKEKILVPWLRPKKLSTDNANSVDVAIHAINWYEKKISKIDGLLLIQPTTPFRSKKKVLKAIEMFKLNPTIPIMSVSKKKNHGIKCYQLNNGLMSSDLYNKIKINEKKLNYYYENGYLYLKSPQNLKKTMSFKSGQFRPLIIHTTKENIDIDTLSDFLKAKKLLNNNVEK